MSNRSGECFLNKVTWSVNGAGGFGEETAFASCFAFLTFYDSKLALLNFHLISIYIGEMTISDFLMTSTSVN